jgi:kynurenine formamidase
MDYFTKGPILDFEASAFLADLPCRTLVLDFPNVDRASDTVVGKVAPNHERLFSREKILVENVVNVSSLPEGEPFFLVVLPLRLVGGDGCPCRVVAMNTSDVGA